MDWDGVPVELSTEVREMHQVREKTAETVAVDELPGEWEVEGHVEEL